MACSVSSEVVACESSSYVKMSRFALTDTSHQGHDNTTSHHILLHFCSAVFFDEQLDFFLDALIDLLDVLMAVTNPQLILFAKYGLIRKNRTPSLTL